MKISSVSIAFIVALCMFSCSDSVDSDPDGNGNGEPAPGLELVYFWYFDVSLLNDTELETIDATYAAATNNAFIEFRSSMAGYPDTERLAALERRNRPTAINYRPSGNQNRAFEEIADSMRAIQVKEPFLGNAGQNRIILHLPTNGYENAVLSFAAQDEDAASGLRFDYSVSANEEEWMDTGLSNNITEQPLITGEYLPYEIDFSGINAVNDNPEFKVRIRFNVNDGTRSEGGRVTFNNFTLDAAPID